MDKELRAIIDELINMLHTIDIFYNFGEEEQKEADVFYNEAISSILKLFEERKCAFVEPLSMVCEKCKRQWAS